MHSKTIYMMPNPYGVLDAAGRLAGACPMVGALGSNGLPQHLGAALQLVPGSYNDRAGEVADAVASGKMLSPVIPPIYSRSESFWSFSAVEPVAVVVTADSEGFYVSRARRNGTPPCLLLCDGPDDLQLEALAAERLDALARYKAERGVDAPVAEWAKQWELDASVAAVSDAVEAKRKHDAAKAEADAKKASDAAEAEAKSAADKRNAAREKAVADAKARFAVPDLVPAAKAKAVVKPIPSQE